MRRHIITKSTNRTDEEEEIRAECTISKTNQWKLRENKEKKRSGDRYELTNIYSVTTYTQSLGLYKKNAI